ncbi:mitochondrial ribosomal protein L28-domain-containing protein [Protomyces lactucae-debilis]|uniref:Large ribosomal subunit protein mL40 n=1 Tax=Protomyces lactucae-debilis TaxID=2754530 RepID=A0A1Y2F7P2_PROLT|nr:mitochondrial ribosomal protein L28-domain-containing protein [Protomyces lactucae-debilis]ORY79879.1 mitochondrial ribosomal protein L28-domain-containing protein [Protomyces lactucae-debilis]
MRDVLFRNATPAKLQLTEEEAIMHDTIHRAWQLHLRRQRTARDVDLERRYNRMREACADLAEHDPKLFKLAMMRDPKAGFPLNARALTETPPSSGWNHDWKRPQE